MSKKSARNALPVTEVDARNLNNLPWGELWRFRELFLFMAWRDFLVRYKQTAIGILWAIIEPLLRMIVLTLVFQKIAGLESSNPVMVFAGVLPWQFFRMSLNTSALSLVNNRNIVQKVYFPRLIMPSSSVLVNLADFLIGFVILLALMLAYGVPLRWELVLVFPLILFAGLFAFGMGLFISTLYVKYRDFKLILPFLLEIGMFLTPVGYSTADVEKTLSAPMFFLYSLNPLVSVVDGCRWAILGGAPINLLSFGISLTVTLALSWVGLRYFRRAEQWFADII